MTGVDEQQSNESLMPKRRRLSGRMLLGVLLVGLAAMFATVSMLVFTTPLARNELGLLGGLKINAGATNVVYVGDRLVGQGEVDVPWNDLLGAAGNDALAVPLSADVPAPSQKTLGGVTAETLAGSGAEIVWSKHGIADVYRGGQSADYALEEVLLRRSDGTLDSVIVIDCLFSDHEGKWSRFLLPIRVRGEEDTESEEYFASVADLGGGKGGRGMIPSRRDRNTFALRLDVVQGALPRDFEAEIKAGQMWRPDRLRPSIGAL